MEHSEGAQSLVYFPSLLSRFPQILAGVRIVVLLIDSAILVWARVHEQIYNVNFEEGLANCRILLPYHSKNMVREPPIVKRCARKKYVLVVHFSSWTINLSKATEPIITGSQ